MPKCHQGEIRCVKVALKKSVILSQSSLQTSFALRQKQRRRQSNDCTGTFCMSMVWLASPHEHAQYGLTKQDHNTQFGSMTIAITMFHD